MKFLCDRKKLPSVYQDSQITFRKNTERTKGKNILTMLIILKLRISEMEG
jgi:hypothetical protein